MAVGFFVVQSASRVCLRVIFWGGEGGAKSQRVGTSRGQCLLRAPLAPGYAGTKAQGRGPGSDRPAGSILAIRFWGEDARRAAESFRGGSGGPKKKPTVTAATATRTGVGAQKKPHPARIWPGGLVFFPTHFPGPEERPGPEKKVLSEY